MIEITVGLCESFKEIGIDISEADLKRFEQALYERGLNVAPLAALAPERDRCIHSWSAPFDGMVKCTKCGSALAEGQDKEAIQPDGFINDYD